MMPVNTTSGTGLTGRCFDRIKFGFLLGAGVGVGLGAMYGSFYALRHGVRGKDLFRLVGSTVTQTGGTFGVFMAVGSGIRC